ncbi:hypothetical protein HXX76_001506 [Chlamydomonas incerta]|uniref:Aspartyl/asparaginy/proline hydroxylase domain-containing protein n=1 Tax=Chlamydomonas incerta TaxID=51695 RepID=A0A835WCC7_CHLIN|nr:hypothetical protein HXX76_001506 [Chlamydomonas incerta]|eukprot:KAG2444762.1 hypothetical protein HXX76_001506 [Chlamydomonas incerta]
MQAVPVRGKLGHASKSIKHLSPRARRLLSLLFLGGVFFFALLSFSTRVRDPEASNSHSDKNGEAKAGSALRRALSSGRGGVSTGASAVHLQAGTSEPAPRKPVRLLLASHNRLFWYSVDNDTTQVLHEGEGVHYGVFPGDFDGDGTLKSVWNVIRPHNWHPKSSVEHLVELDADSGKELSRVRIKSRFTHDAVRRGDRVFLANTEGGEVQELQFPSMKKLRSMALFTLKQHVNTLAPLEADSVWVVLHNLGKSEAVKVDLAADPRPRVVAQIKGVGHKAHGLVAWGASFVVLDSENGALSVVDPSTGEVKRHFKFPGEEDPPKFLKGLCVVDDVAYFGVNVWGSRDSRDSPDNEAELAAVDLVSGQLLWRRRVPTHGLLNIVAAPQLGEASTYRAMASSGGVAGGVGVGAGGADASGSGGAVSVEDAAALGTATAKEVADSARQHRVAAERRDSRRREALAKHHAEAGAGAGEGAGSAEEGAEGGKRHGHRQRRGGGRGKEASLEEPAASEGAGASVGSGDDVVVAAAKPRVATGIEDEGVKAATRKLMDMGYTPKTKGRWASGHPRLDLKVKDTPRAFEAGIQLPLTTVDITKLRDLVLNMPDDMWTPERQRRENAAVDGRKDNMAKFKPGVEALYMVFSDQSTEHVYRFPYYDYFKEAIEPILEKVVGKADMNKVVRLQFARMKPGSEIKLHKDMGGYARFAHRIHLPIVTHPNVSFEVCPNEDGRKLGRRMSQAYNAASLGAEHDCVSIPMAEGMVFELNNRVSHLVLNKSNVKRVQMVVDVAEDPRSPRRLKPGTICNYERAVMVCPQENTLPDY